MGTRHLVCIADGQEVLYSKYGQWDGYPAGVGLSVANWLSDNYAGAKELLRNRAKNIQLIEDSGAHAKEHGVSITSEGWISGDDKGWEEYFQKFPLMTRDTSGAGLLEAIAFGPEESLVSQDWGFDFGFDSLFCEWAYVIDLSRDVLEVYQGFQNERHTQGRWAALNPDHIENDTYYPVKLVAEIPIEGVEQMKGPLLDLDEE